MSVSMAPDGRVVVRWRENGTHHSRKWRPQELEALSRAQDHAGMTLDQLGEEWWQNRSQRLSDATQRLYAWLWDTQVKPHLAAHKLSELNPTVIEDWLAGLTSPVPTQRKALALLHQVLNRAVKS